MNCVYCDKTFTRKFTLKRHIINKDCSLKNTDKLWEFQDNLLNVNTNINSNPTTINGNMNVINGNVNINVIIQPNPISKLNVDYILPEKMKNLVEKYDYDKSHLLLSEYIKDIIHNKEHPENHSVKYVKKRPPTFSNTIENGVNVIKNLKDSCELLSEPVLENLKQKLRQCKKVFKNDSDFLNVYEDTVKEIYKELNKDIVKKALSTVLQTDILNDIEMKLTKQC